MYPLSQNNRIGSNIIYARKAAMANAGLGSSSEAIGSILTSVPTGQCGKNSKEPHGRGTGTAEATARDCATHALRLLHVHEAS